MAAHACQSGRSATTFKHLLDLSDSFEDRDPEVFGGEAQVHPYNGLHKLVSVAQVLFQDGIRWGRIVAHYALAGAATVECVRRNLPGYVELVHDCTFHVIHDGELTRVDQ